MYFLGGGAIKDFFFVLSVGILLGTYSTVYIAAGVVVTSDVISRKMGSKNTNATNVTA